MDADGLTLTGALLVLNSRWSGFRSVTISMDGVEVLVFVKILSRKLYSSISTCGHRRTVQNKETE